MSRTGKWIRLISWGLPLWTACSFGQAPLSRPGMNLTPPLARGVAVTGAKTAVAAPVPPSGPVAPIPMDQLPSAPPQVSYQNGMLTIVAQNSSLGDILREVHKSTGAAIDVPPNATERVVGRIGPGPARDVLATLLNGSAFNYVMLGSAADPTSVASVMLTMRPAGGPGETVANAYQPPPQQYNNMGQQPVMLPGQGPGGPVVQAPAAGDEEADAEEEKDEDTADEDQAQDQAQTGGTVPAQDGSQPNAGPKTPEQILEMLRQRPGQVAPGQPVIPPPNQQQQPPPDDNNN